MTDKKAQFQIADKKIDFPILSGALGPKSSMLKPSLITVITLLILGFTPQPPANPKLLISMVTKGFCSIEAIPSINSPTTRLHGSLLSADEW